MVPTDPIEIPHLAKLCLDKVTSAFTVVYGHQTVYYVRSSDKTQKCLHRLPNQGIIRRCVSELFLGMLCNKDVAVDNMKIRTENEDVSGDIEITANENEVYTFDVFVESKAYTNKNENVAVDNEKIRTENENEVCTLEFYRDSKENTIENEQNTPISDVILNSLRIRNESKHEDPIIDTVSLDSKKCTVEPEQDVIPYIKLLKENNEISKLLTIADDVYTSLHFLRRMYRKTVEHKALFKSVIENKSKLITEVDVILHNAEADFSDKQSTTVMPCGFGFGHRFYDSFKAFSSVSYCSLLPACMVKQESNCCYYKIDSTATKETGIARIIGRISKTDIERISIADIGRISIADIERISSTETADNRELLTVCNNRTEIVVCLFSVQSMFTSQKQLPRWLNANRNSMLSYSASQKLSVCDFSAFLLLHEKTGKTYTTRLEGLPSIRHEKNSCRPNIHEMVSPSLSSRAETYEVKPTSEHNSLQESPTVCNDGINQIMRFLVKKPNHDDAVQMLQENTVDGALFSIKSLGNKGLHLLVQNGHGRNADEKRNIASLDVLDCIRLKKSRSLHDFDPSEMFKKVCVILLPLTVCGIPWNKFERETMRLASFAKYPNSAAKSPANLASSGFVYVGNGTSDRVKCYFCSVEKESWEMNDNIDEIHKSLSPSCPMVIVQFTNNVASIESSPALSGVTGLSTVPYGLESLRPLGAVNTGANSPSTGAGSAHYMQDEVDHLRTHANSQTATESTAHQSNSYQSATVVNSPLQANTNGSINTPGSSHPSSHPVREMLQQANNSAARNNRINPQSQHSQNSDSMNEDATRNLQNHSAAYQDNVSHHPNINRQVYAIPAGSNGTITPANSNSVQPTSQLTYQLLGIFHERPKFPDFAVLARRLQSFDGWPENHPIKKEELAKSGLFFAGYGDCCKCFFCGGGLRNWESDDSAYVEHARWFDKCSYIRQFMGLEFVEAVQAIKSRGGTITFKDVTDYMLERGQSIQNLFNERKISDDAAVRSLIDEGYNAEAVLNAAASLRESGEQLSADVILRKMRELESQTSGAAAAAAVPNGATYSEDVPDDAERMQTLKEQNYALRSNLTCKICMDREVKIVFLPCGHLISCQECAIALQDCPLCRSHIRARARAHIN